MTKKVKSGLKSARKTLNPFASKKKNHGMEYTTQVKITVFHAIFFFKMFKFFEYYIANTPRQGITCHATANIHLHLL